MAKLGGKRRRRSGELPEEHEKREETNFRKKEGKRDRERKRGGKEAQGFVLEIHKSSR